MEECRGAGDRLYPTAAGGWQCGCMEGWGRLGGQGQCLQQGASCGEDRWVQWAPVVLLLLLIILLILFLLLKHILVLLLILFLLLRLLLMFLLKVVLLLMLVLLGKVKKNPANYPLLVDKGGIFVRITSETQAAYDIPNIPLGQLVPNSIRLC